MNYGAVVKIEITTPNRTDAEVKLAYQIKKNNRKLLIKTLRKLTKETGLLED